tara:strand:+ start:335 stop:1057 length:723 start_codon:yes stop_codon:yes gene_type:complete
MNLEDKSQASKLPIKDVATSIATELLRQARSQAVDVRVDEIITVAKKWGANIPEAQEGQFKNELKEAIGEPVSWPTLTVNSVTQTVSTAKNPSKSTKGGSDKTGNLKAADFPLLKAPAGRVITCPVKIISGPNARDRCGKECKRTLFPPVHDPSSKPECASLECDHMFCGTHITKIHAASGNAAKSRLANNNNSKPPVTVEGSDGKTETISTEILNIKEDVQSEAANDTLNKLFEMADDE